MECRWRQESGIRASDATNRLAYTCAEIVLLSPTRLPASTRTTYNPITALEVGGVH